MKLLVATNNAGKLREYRDLLQGLPVTVVSPADEHIELAVDETGGTFVDNAILKAEAFAGRSGLLTLADDSGLEVDTLHGEPGVYSARYGGPEGTDVTRYELLLKKLERVPWEERGARFRCVVAVVAPSSGQSPDAALLAEGRCEGFIARAPRGEHGFGYDPVFFVPQFGRHMAELPAETKNQISHRARAVQSALVAMARQFFPGQPEPGGPDDPRLHLSEMRIRPARFSDAPALHRNCYPDHSLKFVEGRLEWTLAAAAEGRLVALVGDSGVEAIAYVQLSLRGHIAEMSSLIVAEPLRGRGVATALIHVVVEVARDRNVGILTTAVAPGARRVQHFYRKLGFAPYKGVQMPSQGYAGPVLYFKRSLI
jgi:XTP/dITP diphosphohydrolase